MRILFLILAFVIGAASGLALTWTMSARENGFGAVHFGAWTAWPRSGTADADPYARAVRARSGELPLGAAEGIAFVATHDDQGRALDGRCVTRITGRLLTARYWTLTIYDAQGRLIENPAERYGITSAEAVYQSDGQVVILLAPRAHSGNWIPTGENERIVAVFRLYDTPAGVTARGEGAEMPRIMRERCP